MEGKAEEQKESTDFQKKKKKDVCLKSISIPSSSSPSPAHVCATALYRSHAIRFYFAIRKSETTSNTSERSLYSAAHQ